MTLVASPEGAQWTAYCSTASAAVNRCPHHTRAAHAGQGRCGAQRKGRTAPPYNGAATTTDPPLASTQEISAFLAEVERRAFKQAMFAVRDEPNALDIVQDAMLKLTEKYAQKPAGELPMLFQRILQNTIHDHFRRQKVRSTWTTVLSALGKGDEKDEDFDPLETLQAKSDSNAADDPAAQLEQAQVVGLIEDAIARLPARQREAFLLRYWEELDVAETAAAMGCSEGSVKTHCSRAVAALASMLKAKGIAP
jgi:RNA polymerase sigma-70 factor (ECF subfamily)